MFAKVFISLTVLCAIIGTLNAQPVSGDQQDCPQICPDNYDPICGSDGSNYLEFANLCEFKSKNCNLQRAAVKPFVATDFDWCRTEMLDSWNSLLVKMGNIDLNKPECMKPCTKIYEPVCISNGKYRLLASNECLIGNLNCALGNKDTFRVLQTDTC